MTQEAHTPEPWVIHSKVRAIVPLSDAYKVVPLDDADYSNDSIAHTIALIRDPSDGMTEDETYANARRIVACVNALAGIPIEAIESGVVAELAEAARLALLSVIDPDAYTRLANALAKLETSK